MELKRGFITVDQVMEAMNSGRYIADRPLATVIFLSSRLGKPLFLEGEPGVGKTEVALVMSRLFRTRLIRLQCYEGLDSAVSAMKSGVIPRPGPYIWVKGPRNDGGVPAEKKR